MCPMYYKVVKEPPPAETYGYKKVSSKELGGIVDRLTKLTYSAKVQKEEPKQLNNYERVREGMRGRNNPSLCKCNSTEPPPLPPRQVLRRDYTDREYIRLIRRLQKTTLSYHRSTVEYADQKTEEENNRVPPRRTKSAGFDRPSSSVHSRPTTASLAKDVKTCHLCYDHFQRKEEEDWDPFLYDYSDTKSVPPDELEYILDRISVPTAASLRGVHRCKKTPLPMDPELEAAIRDRLPLMSGLKRSRNVKQIVNRLHPRQKHRAVPEATQVSSG